MKASFLLAALFFLCTTCVRAQSEDLLGTCWQKQAKTFETKYLHVAYTDSREQLYHSFEPWQTYKRSTSSNGWFQTTRFETSDTLHSQSGKTFLSKNAYDSSTLLTIDFGDTELSAVTESDWYEALFESARYTPLLILDYLHRHSSETTHHRDSGRIIYVLPIDKAIVKLAVRASDTLVDWITTTENDDLRGDVDTKCVYSGYHLVNGASVASFIGVEKFGGRVLGTVNISNSEIIDSAPTLLPKPEGFHFMEEKEKTPDVSVTAFSDHIHFIDLKHTEARSIMVEFSNFLAVIGAPLSSANGELIIAEANKIAPNKPIKYFAFGHHHPWYVGGMRPFVYRDATVLTTTADIPYLKFLATAPHSLDPDSLFLKPHRLHTEEVHDSTLITDGSYDMKVYWIGKESHHTNDYMIFYFPKERLMEEDDLAWIAQDGTKTKASERQAGLVNAIKALGIVPDTVVQAWPLSGYGVKTVFPYSDLEATVK